MFGREPAAILGVVNAAIALGLGLGLFDLTTEQVGLISAFVAAVFAVIVRQQVTPTSSLEQ